MFVGVRGRPVVVNGLDIAPGGPIGSRLMRLWLECLISLAVCVSVTNAAESEVPVRPSERALETPGFHQENPPQNFTLPYVPEVPSEVPAAGATNRVDSIVFEGNREIATEELLAIAKPFTGRKLSATEIEELRHRITRYYVGKGYINSGAVLPETAYRNDTLTFRIIEGRLEQIRLSGMERLSEAYVRDRLSHKDEPFNVNVLQERFQLLLTDPLFSRMNARVLPGATPGQAILDVDVTRTRPYQVALLTNNYRAPSIGSQAYGASGWLRNLTGFGDVLDATYQEGRGGPRHGLDWSIPVTRYGTMVQARNEQGESMVIEEPFQSIDIKSRFKSKELGLSQPLINRLHQRFVLGLTWSERESTTTLLEVPFSFTPGEPDGRTKLNVWRFSQDYLLRGEQNVLAARSTFSVGRNNIMQDLVSATTPESRYFTWLGQFQYAHRVMDNGAQIQFRGFVQETNDRLVPLERTSIGGVASVRGYRENQAVRDKGYAGSLEFHYPLFGAKGAERSLDAVVFYDHGAVRNQDESSQPLTSTGIGFSGRYKGLFGEVFFAHGLKKLPNEPDSNLQDKGIHFQIRYEIF